MRKSSLAASVAIITTIVATALIACATHQPHPTAATATATPDATTWTWYDDKTGGYTWYVPGRGYTWAARSTATTLPNFTPTPQHMLGAAVPTGWAWVNAFIDTTFGNAGTGKGHVYNIHCVLGTAQSDAGAPLYVMCFDSALGTQPTNGTSPLAGCTSGALTTAGTDVTYSDQGYTHGTAITFTSGLLVAISSTNDTFTAPTTGNLARCDALIGN
jgi:hypothetical protein